ncbi:MAG: tripartite tricarboxylate transporter TctB family protein [Spirochaetales bacterium]|nr:tripartite tricarboxylate transporter TctB family protein [Spirochaetales bacterium]
MKRADRIAALFLLGVCVYAWLAAREFSPLSALFPRVIILILGGLSLLLLALSFVRPGAGRIFVLVEGNALPLALAVIMMVAWVALLAVLGFLVTSLVMFSLMTVVLERRERRPRQILLRVVLVCAVTVGFYFFFDRLLLVSFPRGLLI